MTLARLALCLLMAAMMAAMVGGCSFDTSLEGARFACEHDDGCPTGQGCGRRGVCLPIEELLAQGEGEGERPAEGEGEGGGVGEGEGEETPGPTLDLPGRDAIFAGQQRAVEAAGGTPPLTVDVIEGDAQLEGDVLTGGATVTRLVVQVTDAAERTAQWIGWTVGDARMWLRADELTEVGPVASWSDITGQGGALSPVDASPAPARVAEGPRGASLRFADGALLEAPASPGVNGERFTAALYGLPAPAREAALQIALSSGTGEGGARGWALSRLADRWIGWYGGGAAPRWSSFGPGGALRLGGWQLVVATYDGEAGGITADGRSPMVRPVGYTANDTGPFRVGGDRPDGQAGATFEGLLTEILVWDRVLADGEREALSAYMAARYGTDIDGDGLDDALDSCPGDGGDLAEDGREPDGDDDGVGDDCDRCPDQADDGQEDLDGDGLGDVCDDDRDGDGMSDPEEDDCDSDPGDRDDTGGDADGDGICNVADPCPDTADEECAEADMARPIGRWRFDGDLRDSSGAGRHGRVEGDEGPVEFAAVEGGEALPLHVLVTAPSLAAEPAVVTDFTLRIRLRVDAEDEGHALVATGSGDLQVRWADGAVHMSGLDVPATAPVGEMTSVTFVRAGATGRVYIDGAFAGEGPLSSTSAKAGEWTMGGGSLGGGVIDEIGVWPTSLTDEQVWALDGREGPPLPLPVFIEEEVETGDAPEGLAERIAPRLADGFTVTARLTVPPDARFADTTLLALAPSVAPPSPTWQLRLEDGGWVVEEPTVHRLGPAASGGPFMLALVGTGDELRLYSDGVLRASAYRPEALPGGDRLILGGSGVDGADFVGEIHELAVYDRPLSGDQLRALRGDAVHCPDGCVVDGACHDPGARSLDPDGCGTCVPDVDRTGWTPTCELGSTDSEFADFRQGSIADAGADLLIAANGTVFPYRSLDFDRNGFPDLAFTPGAVGRMRIYLGDDSGFGGEPDLEWEIPATRRQTAADIDLDGHLDFIVTVAGEAGAPRIYWGGADGPAEDRFDDLAMDRPEGLAIGDVDQDGRLDIAVASHGQGAVQLFRGRPNREIDAVPLGFPASTAWSVALADIDRDARLDLLVASHEEESWVFATRGGTLEAAEPTRWDHTFEDGQIAPIDYNGDGYLEIIGLDRYALTRWSFLGRQMSHDRTVELIRATSPLALGDPRRDGRLDALARGARFGGTRFQPLRGGEEGEAFNPGGAATLLADLNGDGWLDVVNAADDPEADVGGQVVFGTPRGFAAGRRQNLDVGGANQGWERSPGSVFDRRELYFYESRAHDAGDPVTGGRIEWDAEVSDATAVAFQVRAASTQDELDAAAWAGPGGDTAGWFTEPGRLPADLDGKQVWQYRARFTRTMPVHGPILQEVRLSWAVVARAAPCLLGETDTGLLLVDGYEQAVRLADGGTVVVAVDADRMDGVVLAVDSEGRERWRAFPGVEGEDRLGSVCAHPDGGLLAMGWSGEQGQVSVPRYLRFDGSGRRLWTASVDDDVFRRPSACLWDGDHWQVLDVYAQGDQSLAWSWVELSDEGERGVGRRLVGTGRAAAAPDGLRRGLGDEFIALVLPFDEHFNVTPRYLRIARSGDVLQDVVVEDIARTTYRAGRTFDRGHMLVVGSNDALAHAARLDPAGVVIYSGLYESGYLYGAEALGPRTLLVGTDDRERQTAARHDVSARLSAGPLTRYPADGISRPLAGIPRADSGALLFVLRSEPGARHQRLSVIRTAPDGSAVCP